MPSNPNKQKIRELLTEKADELLSDIAQGKSIEELCKDIGVFPSQLKKFYSLVPEYRERFRQALKDAAEFNQAAKSSASRKVGRLKGMKTQAEIVAMFEDEILDRISEGETARTIANGLEVARSRISEHFRKTEELAAKYAAASEEGGHALAEMSVEVASEPALDLVDQKAIDVRSTRLAWLASKRNKQYDQRQQLDVKGSLTHSVSIDIQA